MRKVVDLHFSDSFDKVVSFSRDEAMRTGHKAISPDHLMLGILRFKEGDAVACLESCGVSLPYVKRTLDAVLFRKEAVNWSESENVRLSKDAQSVIGLAMVDAILCCSKAVCPVHLLSAICKFAGCFSSRILGDLGFSASDISSYIGEHGDPSVASAPAPEDIALALERELRIAMESGKLGPIVFS